MEQGDRYWIVGISGYIRFLLEEANDMSILLDLLVCF